MRDAIWLALVCLTARRGVLGFIAATAGRRFRCHSCSQKIPPTIQIITTVLPASLSPEEESDSSFSPPGPYIKFGKKETKLNIFGAGYGALAIALGSIWYAALSSCEMLYMLPNFQEAMDPNYQWPIMCSHTWGMALMSLTNCVPVVRGGDSLKDIDGPVMFVANHASYMDIPFVCATIGWTNYKIIAKKELLDTPVLGKSLILGGHVIIDRTNRRSQLESFKRGVKYLTDGVHLVAFAEGTRSKSGRLQPFKKGAFKMAEKANVPIVPLSICNAHRVQPSGFCFPVTHTHSKAFPVEVVIGTPIYPEGKSDAEVTELVWNEIAANLPPDQKPMPAEVGEADTLVSAPA